MADSYANIPVPTPTQNPVPSADIRDHVFGGAKIDEFVTSLVNTYIDRFGTEHYTIEGLRWLAQQAIAAYGWVPAGTFQAGATLTLPNQIIKDNVSGEYYRWDGTLPKIVPSGSTPSSAGGTGVGAWIGVGDSSLRSMLSDTAYGDALIGVIQPYTGSVARTQHDKNSDFVSVKDFGAKGDGSTDDANAIQAALNARMRVWFPPGIYLISKSLIFSNQQIIGSGCMTGSDRGTIIQPTARNFPAFKRDINGYSPGGRIQGFYINFGSTQPTTPQDPTGSSRGIHMGESTDTMPNGSTMFIIEDIVVRGAYYGFYDYGATYLCEYRNCWARNCFLGYRKQGGTTIKYSTCYAVACYGAWWVNQTYVVTFSNCAYDQTVTNQGFRPFFIDACRAVTVNGMDHEAGQINNSGSSDAYFNDCHGVVISGWITLGHSVTNTTGEAYMMRFDGATQAVVNGLINETSTSAGALVYAILVSGTSRVNIRGCNLIGWSGAGTGNNISLGTTGTGVITYDESCLFAGAISGNVRINGCIGYASTPITNLSVPANNLVEIGNLTLTGVTGVDPLTFSFDGDYQRCIFQPKYVGANTVNLTIFNTSATARTITGNLRIYANRY
nr:glycosyl hydrolase family 28-related protein [uncultured Enterobacter sp.]